MKARIDGADFYNPVFASTEKKGPHNVSSKRVVLPQIRIRSYKAKNRVTM